MDNDEEVSEIEKFLTRCDNYGFHAAMQRLEKSKFIGEDGKEYIRVSFPQRFVIGSSQPR